MNLSENSTRILPQTAEFPTKTIQCHRSAKHGCAGVRHVERLGGPAVYICRQCFSHLLAVEFRVIAVDKVRLELAELFDNRRPHRIFGGGMIRASAIIQALAAACAGVRTGGRALISEGRTAA